METDERDCSQSLLYIQFLTTKIRQRLTSSRVSVDLSGSWKCYNQNDYNKGEKHDFLYLVGNNDHFVHPKKSENSDCHLHLVDAPVRHNPLQ
jgi:hypothetical protein